MGIDNVAHCDALKTVCAKSNRARITPRDVDEWFALEVIGGLRLPQRFGFRLLLQSFGSPRIGQEHLGVTCAIANGLGVRSVYRAGGRAWWLREAQGTAPPRKAGAPQRHLHDELQARPPEQIFLRQHLSGLCRVAFFAER